MSKPKSLVKSMSIDFAKKAHNCQHNSNHRIMLGHMRLGVKKERNIEYYCADCALKFLTLAKQEIDHFIADLSTKG